MNRTPLGAAAQISLQLIQGPLGLLKLAASHPFDQFRQLAVGDRIALVANAAPRSTLKRPMAGYFRSSAVAGAGAMV